MTRRPHEYTPSEAETRLEWDQIFPISNITETQETGDLSRAQWQRRVSPGMMPLRRGAQRERPMSEQPGVARDFRLGRAVQMQAFWVGVRTFTLLNFYNCKLLKMFKV